MLTNARFCVKRTAHQKQAARSKLLRFFEKRNLFSISEQIEKWHPSRQIPVRQLLDNGVPDLMKKPVSPNGDEELVVARSTGPKVLWPIAWQCWP
jgi:hypothetical protein